MIFKLQAHLALLVVALMNMTFSVSLVKRVPIEAAVVVMHTNRTGGTAYLALGSHSE